MLLPLKRFLLARKLNDLLKDHSLEFEFSWTGTFGESADGMPFMGETKNLPGVFLVIGCGGNGITFSMLAANLIRNWLDGSEDKLTKIFALDR